MEITIKGTEKEIADLVVLVQNQRMVKKPYSDEFAVNASDNAEFHTLNKNDSCVYECCPHCQAEVAMEWDVDLDGYRAFCPYCGETLMLCGECLQRHNGLCDYDGENDCCRFKKREV